MLYTSYDNTINHLYGRHDVLAQRIASIVLRVMASRADAQQAAASFISARYVELNVKQRKMVYTGPVDIVPEASVRNKGLPTLVWSTPLGELFEAELRFAMCGDDLYMLERYLTEEHIQMYREAIAAQRALIPHLVDFLSLNKTLDRLNQCLTNLDVPNKIIKAIADKVSELDCLWRDYIPEDWLSTPPTPMPKPNKHCIIREVGSSRYMGPQEDVDCYITIQVWSPSSQKQQKKPEQQSWAMVSYSPDIAAQRSYSVKPSASQGPKQGSGKEWGVRILKGMAAAGVALAGLVAGRNDPSVAAGIKSWLDKGWQ